ncbi:MAG: anthranilate phosphoribosyltransferase [Planctomycetota bacterium]|nr:anthranilate phosphoribosyltransferase [Planctomycetota bacterium]
MSQIIRELLHKLVENHTVTVEDIRIGIGSVMDGECSPAQISALLTALRMKGEAVDDIVGTVQAMRERMSHIPTRRTHLLDTCGTGGDRLHTFNISTATALVAAACGIPVAKHGNRGVSSSSGSADVLETLGVNINLTPAQVGNCIDELGIGFCFAPLFHGAMKHAAPIRKELGYRTIFNFVGPLCNPASAEFQLIGVNCLETADLLANALRQLGGQAVIVCGNGELDEVSLWGETTVNIIRAGTIEQTTWAARSFGLNDVSLGDLQVASPQESADRIRSVLENQPGPCRDIVVANTAAALFAAGEVGELTEAAQRVDETISSGRAKTLFDRLVEHTQANPPSR